MKNFKNLLFVALFLITAAVLGQTKITGTVVDETNQPLPGASVLVKGTTNGTSTDFNGEFTLEAKAGFWCYRSFFYRLQFKGSCIFCFKKQDNSSIVRRYRFFR